MNAHICDKQASLLRSIAVINPKMRHVAFKVLPAIEAKEITYLTTSFRTFNMKRAVLVQVLYVDRSGLFTIGVMMWGGYHSLAI